jgi:hypothetical protein
MSDAVSSISEYTQDDIDSAILSELASCPLGIGWLFCLCGAGVAVAGSMGGDSAELYERACYLYWVCDLS